MGQTTDQIEAHIRETRDDLGANLNELEQKVKSATDWKQQFRSHPMTMLGVAFGGGVVLASMLGGRSNRTSLNQASGSSEPLRPWTRGTKHEVLENLDSIKSALVGAAATRFKDVLGEVVPGFTEHLAKAEADRGRESTH